jgi:DNA replication protein DnaC
MTYSPEFEAMLNDSRPRHAAPVDVTSNRVGEVLVRRGVNIDQLLEDDGDPHGKHANIRLALGVCAEKIPRHYRAAVADVPEIHAWVDALVAGSRRHIVVAVHTGPSLLLLGPTGVGKTFQAFGAIRDLAVTGVRARWVATSAADLYASLRPRHQVDSETVFDRYAKADVLLVDDLGAAKATEWTEEVNYRLINHRYEAERPTLFTSNVRPSELGAALGDRVASRLTEMCQRVVLKGSDRRRGQQ